MSSANQPPDAGSHGPEIRDDPWSNRRPEPAAPHVGSTRRGNAARLALRWVMLSATPTTRVHRLGGGVDERPEVQRDELVLRQDAFGVSAGTGSGNMRWVRYG